jgi:hypothetical protein
MLLQNLFLSDVTPKLLSNVTPSFISQTRSHASGVLMYFVSRYGLTERTEKRTNAKVFEKECEISLERETDRKDASAY